VDRQYPEDDGARAGQVLPPAPVVLVGADGGPGGLRALEAAGQLAVRLGTTVVVGLVQPVPAASALGEFVQGLREDLELEVLTQAASVLDPLGVRWRLALETGDAAHGLHVLAQEHDAALVVIGTRGPGVGPALRRLLSRSVSGHLVHHERRPVLVVPAERSRAG
jgi:nucleotide-binding universal stress UspA family protein